MFAWFARRQSARAKALEAYLSHFTVGELAYLKNLSLTDLRPSAFGADDPFISVDLSTYLQAEWMAATGEIPNTSTAKARARAKYRLRLAWDATPARIGTLDGYFRHILPHKLTEPDLSDEAQERLGSHWIVLVRIYENPKNAPTLPELEDIGEGRDWLPS